ncbi:MAG TPA: HEPN domain-containing protein [Bacteroidia bacterium]|nr:HEPN domain-containing protein [Bacteroidia bacterium]
MDKHINQAKSNQKFHNCIHESFTDDYYDWKITSLFYVAIHGMKALITKKGQKAGSTHEEIDNQINPKRENAKLKVSNTCWINYRNLYNYSRSARYDGFTDIEIFKSDKKKDYEYSVKHLQDILKYLKEFSIDI